MKPLSFLLPFAALVAGVAAKVDKAPVNATCPIVLRQPDVSTWKETEGGAIKLAVTNPSSATIGPITVSYTFPNGQSPLTAGGFYPVARGTGPSKARKARSSMGAPTPSINGKTVTWVIPSLSPGQKMVLGIGIRIDPGVVRTNRFRATATYTGPAPTNTPCNTQSNEFAVATRIAPVGTLQSTGGGAKAGHAGATYQQYAPVYRICGANIGETPNITPEACAAACNANPKCTSFVMFSPGSICRLYEETWGNSLVYNTQAGATIYLRDSRPKTIFPGSAAAGCAGP